MASVRPAPRKVRRPGLVRVPFALRADGAREVAVAGEFNRWSPEAGRLAKSADGTWAVDLLLAPGEYQYRLVIDGEWRDHAEASRRVWNGYGTQNCILEVTGSTA